jgi:hypothetical protein
MKLLVLHDAQGNILRMITRPPESPAAGITAGPGELMTEVDAPDLPVDGESEDVQRFTNMLEHFRVEVTTQARLVRKTPPPPR